MEANLGSVNNKEDAWIDKYRAMLALNSPPPPQKSGFKRLCAALTSAHNSTLSHINDAVNRWIRMYRKGEKQNKPSDKCPPPPLAESEILDQGMKRVESLRRQSGKKTRSTTGRSRSTKLTKHIA
jgi:hypothetical protein